MLGLAHQIHGIELALMIISWLLQAVLILIHCFCGVMDNAVAIGDNADGQCNIPLPELGIFHVGDLTWGRDVALQLETVVEDDAISLICSSLVGEERLRLTVEGVDSAWETNKRIARELNVNVPNLQLVLADGQLLAKVCSTNPGASVAEVTQSVQHLP